MLANFPPRSFADVPEARRADDGIFRVVYVGGVTVARGVKKVAEAIDRTSAPRIEFHVAGKAADAAIVERLTQHSKVIYHGLLPWTAVRGLLITADLGVIPLQPTPRYLYCPGENILKLFEYMAAGLPVLISDFPRLKEFVESVNVGMGVDPTSPADIAKAIDYLYRNPEVRRELGENGRRAILEQFNWDREERKMLAVYRRLLGPKAAVAENVLRSQSFG